VLGGTGVSNDGFRPHRVVWTDEKVTRFWDFFAATRSADFFSEKHSRDLASVAMRRRPRTVVDIGCGTGPFVAEMARRGVKANGVDSSEAVLDAARARSALLTPRPEFHLGSVLALPLMDASVDTATLFEVVEHLDDELLRKALSEAHRVLAPGGQLVMTTPNSEALDDGTLQCPDCGAQFHSMQHVRSWTAKSLAGALRAAGFLSIRVRGLRFVENGPPIERLLRRAYYVARRQHPRLMAIAAKG